MSSSDGDLTDTSPTGLFNFAADKIGSGWGIDKFFKTGIGLTIVGLFVGIQRVFDAIITFVVTPLSRGAEAVAALFVGIVEEPVGILESGAETTAAEIAAVWTGWLGPFAFPVAVASVLAGLYLLSIYLEDRQTSDIFPGSFTDIDVPEFVPVIGDPGVRETGEDEDRD